MIIDESLKKDGVCPSYEEMKELIGLKSKSGIHRLIKSLREPKNVISEFVARPVSHFSFEYSIVQM